MLGAPVLNLDMAGGPGFEPELPGPEPGVLPLNYPPVYFYAGYVPL